MAMELACEFGNVTVGDGTARLGVKFDRGVFDALSDAEQMLVGRRLTGRVQVCPKYEADGQGQLFDGSRPEVAGTFDTTRMSVSAKNITAGLTFSLRDVDVAALPSFAKHSGRLVVELVCEVDDVSDDGESDANEDWQPDDDVSEPAAVVVTDADGKNPRPDWKRLPVAELGLSEAKNKTLREAGIKTLGALSDYINKKTAESNMAWYRDLKGIGEALATDISDRFAGFFERHPEVCAAEAIEDHTDAA